MTSHAILGVGALVLAGVMALPVGAYAASPAAAQAPAARAEQAATDAEFVKQAGTSGQQVIDASRTVLEQSANPDVKALAERMVQDHTVAHGELMSLAATPSTAPAPQPPTPTTTPPPVPAQGPAFDRAYLAALVIAHDAMVALFAAEAADGKDERIKLWAQQKLPQLREHLELARTAQRKINALPPV